MDIAQAKEAVLAFVEDNPELTLLEIDQNHIIVEREDIYEDPELSSYFEYGDDVRCYRVQGWEIVDEAAYEADVVERIEDAMANNTDIVVIEEVALPNDVKASDVRNSFLVDVGVYDPFTGQAVLLEVIPAQ